MDKKTRLNEIIKYCEIRFDRGTALEWKHGDFVDLGREIYRDTDINISANTLKRIFGKISVVDDYLPQETTIEALQKYGRYSPTKTSQQGGVPETEQNTIHPEKKTPSESGEIPQPIEKNEIIEDSNAKSVIQDPVVEVIDGNRQPATEKTVSVLANRPKRPSKPIIIFLSVALIIFLFLISNLFKKNKSLDWKIALTSTDSILPSTAEFELKFPETKDSLFMDFGDKSALVYIRPQQRSITHNYFFPGVFDVSLRTKQDAFAKTKVYIRSNNWVGFGFHLLEDIPEHYYALSVVKTEKDSVFYLDNGHLQKSGIDTTGTFYTRLYNFSPVSYTSDNFVFETTFKNDKAKKDIYCNKMQFQVHGMNSFIRFTLVSPGCGSLVLNNVSELSFDGRRNNLSKFAIALESWNYVKLIDHDKHVTLYINGKILYDGKYQNTLGEMKGVFVEFERTGTITNCDVKTIDGKTLYHF
jgi:hypothetical protein